MKFLNINQITRWMLIGWIFSLLSTLAQAESTLSFSQLLTDEAEEQDFLSVDKAFQVNWLPVDGSRSQVAFKVAKGYYLYQSRIQMNFDKPEMGEAKVAQMPPAEEKEDRNFGKQMVYHHDFIVDVSHALSASSQPKALKVRYQGCSEKGLCYPPQIKLFPLDIQSLSQGQASPSLSEPNRANLESIDDDTIDAKTDGLLKSGVWWKIIVGFFGAGLLLAFTPCVFPMVPILSGIIVGKNAHTSKMKAFTLSLAYVLGMCVTYTLAGIAAGMSGQLLSNALQTPLALSLGALIFVVLSFSMFGFYELKLPSHIEHFFFNWSNKLKGGHLLSDFVMGAISALIISPCVAAPLAGALLYISQTQDVVLGGVALFSLSLGMGAPLLLIGASAGAVLPKAGAWMNTVRQLFGVLMLAVALWIVSPILPPTLVMVLWALLCIAPAIYMRAIDPLPAEAGTVTRLLKAVAVVLLAWGLAILVGAWSGARSPLQPLQGFTMQKQVGEGLTFKRIHSVAELEQALFNAKGKSVMLDFYADWCVSCKEYEQYVFSDPRVKSALSGMVLLQADVTTSSADDQALLARFKLFGPPGIVFYNPQGQVISPVVVGYQPADMFLNTLKRINAYAS